MDEFTLEKAPPTLETIEVNRRELETEKKHLQRRLAICSYAAFGPLGTGFYLVVLLVSHRWVPSSVSAGSWPITIAFGAGIILFYALGSDHGDCDRLQHQLGELAFIPQGAGWYADLLAWTEQDSVVKGYLDQVAKQQREVTHGEYRLIKELVEVEKPRMEKKGKDKGALAYFIGPDTTR